MASNTLVPKSAFPPIPAFLSGDACLRWSCSIRSRLLRIAPTIPRSSSCRSLIYWHKPCTTSTTRSRYRHFSSRFGSRSENQNNFRVVSDFFLSYMLCTTSTTRSPYRHFPSRREGSEKKIRSINFRVVSEVFFFRVVHVIWKEVCVRWIGGKGLGVERD